MGTNYEYNENFATIYKRSIVLFVTDHKTMRIYILLKVRNRYMNCLYDECSSQLYRIR